MHNPSWSQLQQLAQQETDRLLRELPPPLREKVRLLPVVFLRKPGPELVADGLDPDLLGLFVGDDDLHPGADPIPSEILLFLDNLWDEAGGNRDEYRQEVRTTLLHEIGHFLGLDEADLFERDLL
jgi:predicted Zn-dependent protease with MMP-like domain